MPCDYEAPIKSIGHGITCSADLLTSLEVSRVFLELSQQIGLKLRNNSLAACGVKIFVRDNKLDHWEYQCRLPFPTQSFLEISEAGFDLFQQKHRWRNDIRSLTISAINLVPEGTPVQMNLWTDFSRHEKKIALEKTVEDIRRRFGLGAINFASLTDGLPIPSNREIEYKMPSVMYQ